MKRALPFILVILLASAALRAEESDRPDARYRKEIARLKRRLGRDFTVKQVGMFVAAWDLDEKKAESYEKLIKELEEALYERFLSRRPAEVIRVVLFKDNASLRRNAKKVAEKSIVMPAGGFYMTYEHTLCAEVTMGPWLVRHELTHALVHGDFGSKKPAPWFDEGMAMMVESAVIEGKKLTFRADRRLNLVHRLMKARKLPKLKDVLKMDFRTYNAPATRATADALSRCLMLYLDEKGVLVKFYRRYRIRYRRDPTATKFVEELLEKDIDAVETDLLAWVEAKVRESRESTKKPSSKEPAKPPEMGHKPRKTETVAAIQREKLAIMSS